MTTGDPMDDLPVPQALPLAPPTEPGELSLSARRSVWPMVLGIIAVVFGGFATLGGLWGAVAPFVMDGFARLLAQMPSAPGQDPAKMFEAMGEYRYLLMATSLASTAVAVLLLVAGIALMRRRPSARRLCMAWAGRSRRSATVPAHASSRRYLAWHTCWRRWSGSGGQSARS